ncbi:hypothetical protein ACLG6S_04070 [Thermodesulfobacteriota bacterium B35]
MVGAKRMKWLLVLVIVCFAMLLFLYSMRKSLPYDFRIIRLGNKLFIHNKEIWNSRNLDVRYVVNRNKGVVALDGSSNTAVLPLPDQVVNLKLKITRKDLKGRLLYRPFLYEGPVPEKKRQYIVFIGASIGRDWELEQLPERQPALRETAVLFWPVFRFDKQEVIDHVLKIPIKPAAVLIKECAAYFPLNVEQAGKKYLGWFDELKKNNLEAVAVTTVPVTISNENQNLGRAESINKFNSFLKSSGEKVFDLIPILSDPQSGGTFLQESLAQEDGLHLNLKAYRLLDSSLAEFLIVNMP